MLWPLLLRIVPAMFAGIALGLVALRELERGVMVPVLGATIVGIAVWNLAAPRLRKRESLALDLVFGGVAGVFSGESAPTATDSVKSLEPTTTRSVSWARSGTAASRNASNSLLVRFTDLPGCSRSHGEF